MSETDVKIGLIVNPIAGLGGRVGLKGTDGKQIVKAALERGAEPLSNKKAAATLQQLNSRLTVITAGGPMGEDTAKDEGFESTVVYRTESPETSPIDTINAFKNLIRSGVEIVLFAGGDGTARDICSVYRQDVPVIGIPAGVKIHSAVFATSPRHAGDIVKVFLNEKNIRLINAEVVDLDEDLYRQGVVSAKLFGTMKIPYVKNRTQGVKSGSPESELYVQDAIAAEIVDSMENEVLYIIGPGTTTSAVMNRLDIENTLLGVDIVENRQIIGKDLSENEILNLIDGKNFRIIITPIGGQGFLFGRGNQQISPDIIRMAGKENIIIMATKEKLISLQGCPLIVDTGDEELDRDLAGHISVYTGYNERTVYKVTN